MIVNLPDPGLVAVTHQDGELRLDVPGAQLRMPARVGLDVVQRMVGGLEQACATVPPAELDTDALLGGFVEPGPWR
jgi:hypothetical protein